MVPFRLRLMIKHDYPLVIQHIAIENGPVEIVDFPIKHGDFSIAVCTFTRG